jgi:hypothetical protein
MVRRAIRSRALGAFSVCLLLVTAAACSDEQINEGRAPDSGAPSDGGSDGGGGDVLGPDAAGPGDGGSGDTGAGDAAGPGGDTGGGDTGGGDTGGGDTGGGDTGGGDTTGGGSVDYTPSDEMARIGAEIEKLLSTGQADIDGDGAPDTTRETANGGVVLTFDPQGGAVDVVYSKDATSAFTWVADADLDGVADSETVFTPDGSTPTEVILQDTDGDGFSETRTTHAFDYEAATITYTVEVDTDADGTFDTQEVTVTTLTRNDGEGDCEGLDGMPDAGDGGVYTVPHTRVHVLHGSGAGRCSPTMAAQVAAAADCAFSKGGLCLANSNPELAAKLFAAQVGDGPMDIDIACGNSCAGVLASTRSYERPWFSNSMMNINPDEWSKLDSDKQCGLMLHELLHWAGEEGAADHNDLNEGGDDDVYSCGRYCGLCSDFGKGSPNNSSIDCARCSKGKERKKKCGTKEALGTYPCNGDGAGLCHQGLGCIAGNCEECAGTRLETCDDKGLTEPEFLCCNTCPSSCNGSNDLPCGGNANLSDNCTESSPPFCK